MHYMKSSFITNGRLLSYCSKPHTVPWKEIANITVTTVNETTDNYGTYFQNMFKNPM